MIKKIKQAVRGCVLEIRIKIFEAPTFIGNLKTPNLNSSI
jgi:hypothetical protein